MSQTPVLWIIRAEGGALKGPFDTSTIMNMIKEGAFHGNELIARYPDGNWTFISREPEFYEQLMEALEGAVRMENRKVQKVMTEETIFMPPPPPDPKKALTVEVKPQPIAPVIQQPIAPPSVEPPPEKKNLIIDLRNLGQMEKEQIIRVIRIPAAILLAVIGIAVWYFLSSGDGSSDKISLIAPGPPAAPLGEKEIREKFLSAINDYSRDTFEGYLQAQNKLVAIVEGAPMNIEVRGVLCATYKELWPFAKQDNNDQKVVSTVAQSTRSLNVVSPFGGLCEIVKLMTLGRYREARGAVESILESAGDFNLLPIAYEFKAELLEGDRDYQNAAPYYEKAAQLWENWLKPRVRLGFTLRSTNPQGAAEQFRLVLTRNPNHKAAKIGLGLVEANGFKQYDNAYSFLSAALASNSRVPRTLESEGYQTMGEILADRGEKRKALDAANHAFQLNPNNEAARQLVLRLGGSDKLDGGGDKQDNELVFLGDQYVRQGDCLSAQAEFKAAFELDPKNGTAAMKAAKCLWLLNQSYEAIDWLARAIKADPKLISAYVMQSDYLSQRYDFTGATQALSNAARQQPNNYEVLRGMALLEFRKNNMTGTVNYALRALKAYDADIETYVLLSKANLAMALGIQSTRKSDLDRKDAAAKDAVRYATKAIELDATHTDAQITYAKMLAATTGVDSAINYLAELIKRYSFSYEYRVALAEVYKGEERYTQAKEIYEQVVEIDPRNKKAWLGLGECLKASGLNERALKAFLNAAVLDPTDGEALFQAGKLYLETNRFEEAAAQFRRVYEMNPNFPRANYYIGKAAFLMGRFEEALRAGKEEKRINPNLADAYILTAEVLSTQGAYSACAAEYAQAIKLRPQGAEIYVKTARCYRQAGSLDIAETMLVLAKERESGYADIYLELGAIFSVKGDRPAAIRSYRNYIDLAPNAADRKEVERRIQMLGG